jgi:pyruvate/2-oxoglutarate dehydrogenase complex dihydrolipoamide acyltransferase (E2) component
MDEEKKEKGFVIKDRRHFDESGDLRTEEEAKKAEEKKPEAAAGPAPAAPEEPAATGPEDAPLPEINFSGFIFSLSTTAMYHFGDFPDPVTKEAKRNLPAAKQTIDILTIMKEKTKGNLDEDENQLLDDILYELRMRFIKEMTRP